MSARLLTPRRLLLTSFSSTRICNISNSIRQKVSREKIHHESRCKPRDWPRSRQKMKSDEGSHATRLYNRRSRRIKMLTCRRNQDWSSHCNKCRLFWSVLVYQENRHFAEICYTNSEPLKRQMWFSARRLSLRLGAKLKTRNGSVICWTSTRTSESTDTQWRHRLHSQFMITSQFN